ncbi:hypothetical protein BLNAU_16021 [Blattamonas nauphoetae]|uniref:Trichohyalin-like n=1 Tax=Blattamonas nauphoetae TaxID=2049346 RepID=A0ABQ9XAQ7_9EUKA|nr:hypothetical protein BLNAU_16021 [Blattamonas nauphoetae]
MRPTLSALQKQTTLIGSPVPYDRAFLLGTRYNHPQFVDTETTEGERILKCKSGTRARSQSAIVIPSLNSTLSREPKKPLPANNPFSKRMEPFLEETIAHYQKLGGIDKILPKLLRKNLGLGNEKTRIERRMTETTRQPLDEKERVNIPRLLGETPSRYKMGGDENETEKGTDSRSFRSSFDRSNRGSESIRREIKGVTFDESSEDCGGDCSRREDEREERSEVDEEKEEVLGRAAESVEILNGQKDAALHSSPSLGDSEGSEKEQNWPRFPSPSDIHTPPSISELGGEEDGAGREEAEKESEHRSSTHSFPHPSSLGNHPAGPELGEEEKDEAALLGEPMESEEVRLREWKEGDGEDESESGESVHLVLRKEAMELKLRCSSDSLGQSGEESSWRGDWEGDVEDVSVSDWSGFEDESSESASSIGEQTFELTSFPADRTTRSRTTPNTPLWRKRKPKQPAETRIILGLLQRDRKVQTATGVRRRQSGSPKRSGRVWWEKREEKEETQPQHRFQLPLLDIGKVVAEDFETGPDAARFGSTPRLSTVLGKRGSGGWEEHRPFETSIELVPALELTPRKTTLAEGRGVGRKRVWKRRVEPVKKDEKREKLLPLTSRLGRTRGKGGDENGWERLRVMGDGGMQLLVEENRKLFEEFRQRNEERAHTHRTRMKEEERRGETSLDLHESLKEEEEEWRNRMKEKEQRKMNGERVEEERRREHEKERMEVERKKKEWRKAHGGRNEVFSVLVGEDTLVVELAQTDRFSVLTDRTQEWEEETAKGKEGEMSEKKRNVRPLSSLEGREDAGQWARCGRGEEAEGEDTVRMEGEDEDGARLDDTVHPPSPPFFRSDTAESTRREWTPHPTPQVVSALDSPQFATPVSSRRGSKKRNEGEMEDTLRTLSGFEWEEPAQTRTEGSDFLERIRGMMNGERMGGREGKETERSAHTVRRGVRHGKAGKRGDGKQRGQNKTRRLEPVGAITYDPFFAEQQEKLSEIKQESEKEMERLTNFIIGFLKPQQVVPSSVHEMTRDDLEAEIGQLNNSKEQLEKQCDIMKTQIRQRDELLLDQRTRYLKEITTMKEQLFQQFRIGQSYEPDDHHLFTSEDFNGSINVDMNNIDPETLQSLTKQISDQLSTRFNAEKKRLQSVISQMDREHKVKLAELERNAANREADLKIKLDDLQADYDLLTATRKNSPFIKEGSMENPYDIIDKMEKERSELLIKIRQDFDEELQHKLDEQKRETAAVEVGLTDANKEIALLKDNFAKLERLHLEPSATEEFLQDELRKEIAETQQLKQKLQETEFERKVLQTRTEELLQIVERNEETIKNQEKQHNNDMLQLKQKLNETEEILSQTKQELAFSQALLDRRKTLAEKKAREQEHMSETATAKEKEEMERRQLLDAEMEEKELLQERMKALKEQLEKEIEDKNHWKTQCEEFKQKNHDNLASLSDSLRGTSELRKEMTGQMLELKEKNLEIMQLERKTKEQEREMEKLKQVIAELTKDKDVLGQLEKEKQEELQKAIAQNEAKERSMSQMEREKDMNAEIIRMEMRNEMEKVKQRAFEMGMRMKSPQPEPSTATPTSQLSAKESDSVVDRTTEQKPTPTPTPSPMEVVSSTQQTSSDEQTKERTWARTESAHPSVADQHVQTDPVMFSTHPQSTAPADQITDSSANRAYIEELEGRLVHAQDALREMNVQLERSETARTKERESTLRMEQLMQERMDANQRSSDEQTHIADDLRQKEAERSQRITVLFDQVTSLQTENSTLKKQLRSLQLQNPAVSLEVSASDGTLSIAPAEPVVTVPATKIAEINEAMQNDVELREKRSEQNWKLLVMKLKHQLRLFRLWKEYEEEEREAVVSLQPPHRATQPPSPVTEQDQLPFTQDGKNLASKAVQTEAVDSSTPSQTNQHPSQIAGQFGSERMNDFRSSWGAAELSESQKISLHPTEFVFDFQKPDKEPKKRLPPSQLTTSASDGKVVTRGQVAIVTSSHQSPRMSKVEGSPVLPPQPAELFSQSPAASSPKTLKVRDVSEMAFGDRNSQDDHKATKQRQFVGHARTSSTGQASTSSPHPRPNQLAATSPALTSSQPPSVHPQQTKPSSSSNQSSQSSSPHLQPSAQHQLQPTHPPSDTSSPSLQTPPVTTEQSPQPIQPHSSPQSHPNSPSQHQPTSHSEAPPSQPPQQSSSHPASPSPQLSQQPSPTPSQDTAPVAQTQPSQPRTEQFEALPSAPLNNYPGTSSPPPQLDTVPRRPHPTPSSTPSVEQSTDQLPISQKQVSSQDQKDAQPATPTQQAQLNGKAKEREYVSPQQPLPEYYNNNVQQPSSASQDPQPSQTTTQVRINRYNRFAYRMMQQASDKEERIQQKRKEIEDQRRANWMKLLQTSQHLVKEETKSISNAPSKRTRQRQQPEKERDTTVHQIDMGTVLDDLDRGREREKDRDRDVLAAAQTERSLERSVERGAEKERRERRERIQPSLITSRSLDRNELPSIRFVSHSQSSSPTQFGSSDHTPLLRSTQPRSLSRKRGSSHADKGQADAISNIFQNIEYPPPKKQKEKKRKQGGDFQDQPAAQVVERGLNPSSSRDDGGVDEVRMREFTHTDNFPARGLQGPRTALQRSSEATTRTDIVGEKSQSRVNGRPTPNTRRREGREEANLHYILQHNQMIPLTSANTATSATVTHRQFRRSEESDSEDTEGLRTRRNEKQFEELPRRYYASNLLKLPSAYRHSDPPMEHFSLPPLVCIEDSLQFRQAPVVYASVDSDAAD